MPNPWGQQVTVDPTDSSCWVSGPGGVSQVKTDGSVPTSLLISPSRQAVPDFVTGTYWGANWADANADWAASGGVNDYEGDPLRHYGADAGERWKTGEHFSVDSRSWNFQWDETNRTFWAWNSDLDLVCTSEAGEELYRHTPLDYVWDQAALDPSDGSLAFVNGKSATMLRIARDGTEQSVSLSCTPHPVLASRTTAFAVNPHDGSLWMSLGDGRTTATGDVTPGLFHLAADGAGLSEIPATGASLLAVDLTDDSLWVGESYPVPRFAHFSAGRNRTLARPESKRGRGPIIGRVGRLLLGPGFWRD